MYSRHLNDINLRRKYNFYKNKLSKLISNSKKIYAQKQIKNSVNQSKALWKCVDEICNHTKTEVKIEKINSMTGELLESDRDKANSFNQYYSTLGQRYADRIVETEYSEEKQTIDKSMYLYPTSIDEVEQMIGELKSRKSTGCDDIRAETLKSISDEIKTPLTHLVNQCFERGYFPRS